MLLRHSALLMDVLISLLIVRGSLNHLSIVSTMLFGVCLMARRWISQSHGPLAFCVTAVDVAVAVAVNDLIAIDEDQVSGMGLLYALGERLLLVP